MKTQLPLLAALCGLTFSSAFAQTADTIYTGGPFITVNRTTRSGKVQGPSERVTPMEGLKAITLWGARQHFEEKTKGSLEVGKLADLVILSDNPLTIAPMKINKIQVVETIKEGKTIYSTH